MNQDILTGRFYNVIFALIYFIISAYMTSVRNCLKSFFYIISISMSFLFNILLPNHLYQIWDIQKGNKTDFHQKDKKFKLL